MRFLDFEIAALYRRLCERHDADPAYLTTADYDLMQTLATHPAVERRESPSQGVE